MDNLRITLVQSTLAWENRTANLSHLRELLLNNRPATDLVVLPEMFTTAFTMQPEKNAEEHEGEGLLWMKELAKELHCAVTGSICVKEGGRYYNRLYYVQSDGAYRFYNKRHLFRMGNEDQHYTPGREKLLVTIRDWKALPLVCYDLRFPVWSRNKWQQTHGQLTAEYDVLIYVANWPEARGYAWKQLLIARAIENQCYVIGVNRVGVDGNNIAHAGDSLVVDPLGKIINKTKPNEENVETVTLDYAYLQELRKKFPVGMDADAFGLKID